MTDKFEIYEPPRMIPLDRAMTLRGPLDQRSAPPIESLAGHDPLALMERYGSPLFLFDSDRLTATYRAFLEAFRKRWSKTTIAYSVKTNYLSAVVACLSAAGAKMEVVSGLEYEICRRLGIPGAQITFNGPWKKSSEIEEAFRCGSVVNFDNYDEVVRAEAVAQKVPGKKKVGIRVNMEVSYPPWDKFGFNLTTGEALKMAERLHQSQEFDLVGLHMHIGTYIPNPDQYRKGAEALIELAMKIRARTGKEIETLDLGGGYASSNTLRGQVLGGNATSPTADMYAEAITGALHDARTKHHYEPNLVIEPGRAIVDECADLFTTVVSVKPLMGGGRAAIIDAGVNVLPTAYWYDHETVPVRTVNRSAERVKLFGPLCMQIDVVRPSVVLPVPTAGDVYCLRRVGAYNFSQSMQFIYARPTYLWKTGKRIDVIRRAETLDDLVRCESLPDHLLPKGAAKKDET